MDGWSIQSTHGDQRFVFPPGFRLSVGDYVTVWSGPAAESKENPPTDLVWTTAYVWNNTGDTAILYDGDGEEVARIAEDRLDEDHPDYLEAVRQRELERGVRRPFSSSSKAASASARRRSPRTSQRSSRRRTSKADANTRATPTRNGRREPQIPTEMAGGEENCVIQ